MRLRPTVVLLNQLLCLMAILLDPVVAALTRRRAEHAESIVYMRRSIKLQLTTFVGL